jgi:hypothetical protein
MAASLERRTSSSARAAPSSRADRSAYASSARATPRRRHAGAGGDEEHLDLVGDAPEVDEARERGPAVVDVEPGPRAVELRGEGVFGVDASEARALDLGEAREVVDAGGAQGRSRRAVREDAHAHTAAERAKVLPQGVGQGGPLELGAHAAAGTPRRRSHCAA